MAFIIYDKLGVAKTVHHPVDVAELLGTGNFSIDDPTKVEKPRTKLDPIMENPISMDLDPALKVDTPVADDAAASSKSSSGRKTSRG